MTTDTTEKGLESIIVRHMTGTDGLAVKPNMVAERPPAYGGTGYTAGSADVVTGKLDVRKAALHLPDEAPPDTVEDDADLNTDADAIDEEPIVE